MNFLERRAVPRLDYPPGRRPVFVVGGREYEVVDCAERGLRFVAGPEGPPAITTEMLGQVRFRSGQKGDVEGVVVRHAEEGTVGLHFTGIWLAPELIERERRWLRREETDAAEPTH